MSGRYRSSKGINSFIKELSPLDKNKYLNIDFDSIIKKGYNVLVLNHQPGIGKTYTVMDYIMRKCKEDDKFSFFYFTDKHKTIKEHLEKLKDRSNKEEKEIIEGFGHWEGFGRHCNTKEVKKLLEFQIPIDTIRKLYEVEKCYNEYIDQFKNYKRVFAPFQYLSNDIFKKNPPQIVFLDERISQIESYSFDSNSLSKGLELIKAPDNYIQKAKHGNKEFFTDEKVIEKIKGLYKKKVISASYKNLKSIDKYKEFNPFNLEKYLYWDKIYDYENNYYSYPIYYNALDVLTNEIPIVILDATFNKYLFSYFLESYNGEMKRLCKMEDRKFKGFKDLKVKILKSKASNYGTKIFRMHPKGCWPKINFTEYKDTTWKWLLKDLHQLRLIVGDANIGIITYKELAWLFESMNFDVEYFGNLRGTNKLEKKIVLVIVGTWIPILPSWSEKKEINPKKDYLDNLVQKYFLRKIEEKDCVQVSIGAPPEIEDRFKEIYSSKRFNPRIKANIDFKRVYDRSILIRLIRYKEYSKLVDIFPTSMINQIWYDEIYQAYHRNRGLRYDRFIFSYGWFPEPQMRIKYGDTTIIDYLIEYDLRHEFRTVEKIFDEERKQEIFDSMKYEYKGGLMQDLMRDIETQAKSGDIASLYKIHKKGVGADTKPITELKKSYDKVKDLVQYPENE